MMLKNEKQYNSAKAKLEKWLKTREQLHNGNSAKRPDWLIAEQAFGVEEEIKQLQAELQEYEDTFAGKKNLPDPSLIEQIPYLLISWRIARHWTQRDLADRVRMHENQIQKYESENYACASLQTISKIAEALRFKENTVGNEKAETKRREMNLAAACDAANADAGLTDLEADFQSLENTVNEPFDKHGW